MRYKRISIYVNMYFVWIIRSNIVWCVVYTSFRNFHFVGQNGSTQTSVTWIFEPSYQYIHTHTLYRFVVLFSMCVCVCAVKSTKNQSLNLSTSISFLYRIDLIPILIVYANESFANYSWFLFCSFSPFTFYFTLLSMLLILLPLLLLQMLKKKFHCKVCQLNKSKMMIFFSFVHPQN